MPDGGSLMPKERQSPCATQNTAVAPRDTSQLNAGSTYKSTHEPFFSPEDISSHSLSESSRSIRRTRSAARISSIFASSSSKDIRALSPVASTPSRGRTDLNTMSSGTPHLDHVLSFHQKLSPLALSHDGFASLALEADTSGSHDSINSCFGNWRFYSSSLGRVADSEIPPTSSDGASLCDSDSSQEEHQIILLSRAPSVARSEPSLSVIKPVSAVQEEPHYKLPIMIPRKRSKSLSALPAPPSGSSFPSISISATSRQDYVRALCINSSFEARRFARCSADDLSGTDVSMSSATSFELVKRVKKSARNGKRITLASKSITSPFGRIHKAINRLRA